MRKMLVVGVAMAVSACASPLVAQPAPNSPEAHGHRLLQTYCASCHAIERTGRSREEDAPEFRTLSQRYPVSDLAEALAEGIMVGHSDMPEIQFGENEVHAIIAYLKSIQDKADRSEDDDAS